MSESFQSSATLRVVLRSRKVNVSTTIAVPRLDRPGMQGVASEREGNPGTRVDEHELAGAHLWRVVQAVVIGGGRIHGDGKQGAAVADRAMARPIR